MSYGGTSATPGQRSQTGMPARGRANALPQTGQNSQVRQQAHLHLTNPQAMQPAQGNVMFNPMYAATPQLAAPMPAGYPPQSYYFVSQQATAPAQTAPPNERPIRFHSAAKEDVVYLPIVETSTGKNYLATVCVDPVNEHYGKIIHRLYTLHNNDELHHTGWNTCASCYGNQAAKRTKLILPSVGSSRIYVIDTSVERAPKIHAVVEPAELKAHRVSKPHTCHYMSNGDVLISTMADERDNNKGAFVVLDGTTWKLKGTWNNQDIKYGYDFSCHQRENVLVSTGWGKPSSWWKGLDRSRLREDYGSDLHVWDLKKGEYLHPLELGDEGRMPMGIKFLNNPARSEGFVCCAYSSNVFRLFINAFGEWQAEKVIDIPDKKVKGWTMPLMPGLITNVLVSMDDRFLYLSNWIQGDLRQYDITDTRNPKLVGRLFLGGSMTTDSKVEIVNDLEPQPYPVYVKGRKLYGGPQMIQLSLDGKRLYLTDSLITPWDKQFYPEMVENGCVMLQVDCDTEKGGLSLNENFLTDFGNESNEIRHPRGDSYSDSNQPPPYHSIQHSDSNSYHNQSLIVPASTSPEVQALIKTILEKSSTDIGAQFRAQVVASLSNSSISATSESTPPSLPSSLPNGSTVTTTTAAQSTSARNHSDKAAQTKVPPKDTGDNSSPSPDAVNSETLSTTEAPAVSESDVTPPETATAVVKLVDPEVTSEGTHHRSTESVGEAVVEPELVDVPQPAPWLQPPERSHIAELCAQFTDMETSSLSSSSKPLTSETSANSQRTSGNRSTPAPQHFTSEPNQHFNVIAAPPTKKNLSTDTLAKFEAQVFASLFNSGILATSKSTPSSLPSSLPNVLSHSSKCKVQTAKVSVDSSASDSPHSDSVDSVHAPPQQQMESSTAAPPTESSNDTSDVTQTGTGVEGDSAVQVTEEESQVEPEAAQPTATEDSELKEEAAAVPVVQTDDEKPVVQTDGEKPVQTSRSLLSDDGLMPPPATPPATSPVTHPTPTTKTVLIENKENTLAVTTSSPQRGSKPVTPDSSKQPVVEDVPDDHKKITYSREFLISLQKVELSLAKPDGLGNNILQEIMSSGRSMPNVSSHRRDFNPDYFKPANKTSTQLTHNMSYGGTSATPGQRSQAGMPARARGIALPQTGQNSQVRQQAHLHLTNPQAMQPAQGNVMFNPMYAATPHLTAPMPAGYQPQSHFFVSQQATAPAQTAPPNVYYSPPTAQMPAQSQQQPASRPQSMHMGTPPVPATYHKPQARKSSAIAVVDPNTKVVINEDQLSTNIEEPSNIQVTPTSSNRSRPAPQHFTSEPSQHVNVTAAPPTKSRAKVVDHKHSEETGKVRSSATRITYSRDFLLSLQKVKLSLSKPDHLGSELLQHLMSVREPTCNPVPKQRVFNSDYFKPVAEKHFTSSNSIATQSSSVTSPRGREVRVKPEGMAARLDGFISEEDSAHMKLLETFRSKLNKLAPSNFGAVLSAILPLPVRTEKDLNEVMMLVFDKARNEPEFSKIYATLCQSIAKKYKVKRGGSEEEVNFRKLLLVRCQKEFERLAQDDTLMLEKMQNLDKALEKAQTTEEKNRLNEEFKTFQTKARHRKLGYMRFLGELFLLQMLTVNIMHECVICLLKAADEESLEYLCRLWTTIGKVLDTNDKARGYNDQYFAQMKKIATGQVRNVSPRIRRALQDVIELRQVIYYTPPTAQMPAQSQQQPAGRPPSNPGMAGGLPTQPNITQMPSSYQNGVGIQPQLAQIATSQFAPQSMHTASPRLSSNKHMGNPLVATGYHKPQPRKHRVIAIVDPNTKVIINEDQLSTNIEEPSNIHVTPTSSNCSRPAPQRFTSEPSQHVNVTAAPPTKEKSSTDIGAQFRAQVVASLSNSSISATPESTPPSLPSNLPNGSTVTTTTAAPSTSTPSHSDKAARTKEKSSTDIGAQFRAQVVASLSNSSISATSESTPPSLPSNLPTGSTVTTTTAAPSTSTRSHSDKSAQLKEKSSTDIGAQFRAQVVASLSNSSISATSESTPPSLPSNIPNGSTVTTTTAAPSTSISIGAWKK